MIEIYFTSFTRFDGAQGANTRWNDGVLFDNVVETSGRLSFADHQSFADREVGYEFPLCTLHLHLIHSHRLIFISGVEWRQYCCVELRSGPHLCPDTTQGK